MINHNIVGLDIAMHDTLAVAEVERLQQLEDIVADIIVGKAGVQSPEVGVIDSLEDQAGGFALVVTDDVQQRHHIRTTGQILENLDLSLNLLFLHGLENLDDTFLIVDDVDALEYLGVLSSAYNRTESANSRSGSVPTVQGAAAGGYRHPSGEMGSNQARFTYLANNLVVLQHAPRNVDTIIVPIRPRHMVIDIVINARHDDRRWLPSPRPQSR